MKKIILVSLLLIIPASLLSYYWESFGPDSEEVYDYLFIESSDTYAGVSDGVMVYDWAGWIKYEYGLPVWKMLLLDENHILLIMGNGSWSDGIYTFDLISHNFTVQQWLYEPNFLEFNSENSTYYVGYEYGLQKSNDGYNWTEVAYFNEMNCSSMICYQNYIVVSANSHIHISNDFGNSWEESLYLPLSDFTVTDEGVIYGIFPDHSNSSGLWKSENFGVNWDVEFYSDSMIAVELDCNSFIFVAWEEPFEQYEGIGIWDSGSQNLSLINEELPCLEINDIEIFPLVDCPAMICCTDSGGYFVTDYQTSVDDDIFLEDVQLRNFPNPFSCSTTIFFLTPDYTDLLKLHEIKIYNIKGQKIKTFSNLQINKSPNQQIIWDGTDEKGGPVPGGIYLYKLVVENQTKGFHKLLILR
ncbi:MAG: T9SS type A sorting domain-containing protein [Candidatus Cloacimonetes bacterium]|nr:T9SS type A sorting domain-containing protein [Candidatus Cloacimonadota bacterium]